MCFHPEFANDQCCIPLWKRILTVPVYRFKLRLKNRIKKYYEYIHSR